MIKVHGCGLSNAVQISNTSCTSTVESICGYIYLNTVSIRAIPELIVKDSGLQSNFRQNFVPVLYTSGQIMYHFTSSLIKPEDHGSCKRSPDDWTNEVAESLFKTKFM